MLSKVHLCVSLNSLSSLPLNSLTFIYALFHDRDPFHIETGPLISSANQWTGFYMIGTSVLKELKYLSLNGPETHLKRC